MAITTVACIARNSTYDSAAILTESDAGTLATAVNDAIDALTNFDFLYVEIQMRRDDDTPGS
jgi:hypothetical protein